MRLLPRFLQQNTHDLRRWHHHFGFSCKLLPLTINSRRSSYLSLSRVSRLLRLHLQINGLNFILETQTMVFVLLEPGSPFF